MERESHDLWCVIAYVVRGYVHTTIIPESLVDIALDKGWNVVARDSEIPPTEIEPSQSGPRIGDE